MKRRHPDARKAIRRIKANLVKVKGYTLEQLEGALVRYDPWWSHKLGHRRTTLEWPHWMVRLYPNGSSDSTQDRLWPKNGDEPVFVQQATLLNDGTITGTFADKKPGKTNNPNRRNGTRPGIVYATKKQMNRFEARLNRKLDAVRRALS